jgi:hypothetical protein
MHRASRSGGTQARFTPWPSRPERGATQRPGERRARRGVRLGRPNARPRHNAGVRWPGTHACTHPRARRAVHPPGSRGCARRCQHGEVRCPALITANNQARVEARLPHRSHPARRRRAQGHGLPGISSSSREATHAARLARGQVQSALWGARATAVPKHAWPRNVHSARLSGDQRRSTR